MTYPNAPDRWAILVSVLVGIIGLQWWLVPQTYPSVGQLGSGWAAALAGLLGVAGMVTGWALRRPLGRIARRLATVGAGLQVVAFGYVASDGSLAKGGADPLYVVSALAAGSLWVALVAGRRPAEGSQIAKHAGVSRNLATASGAGQWTTS